MSDQVPRSWMKQFVSIPGARLCLLRHVLRACIGLAWLFKILADQISLCGRPRGSKWDNMQACHSCEIQKKWTNLLTNSQLRHSTLRIVVAVHSRTCNVLFEARYTRCTLKNVFRIYILLLTVRHGTAAVRCVAKTIWKLTKKPVHLFLLLHKSAK